LDTSVWIAIYLPLFIAIFASVSEQKRRTMFMRRKNKKKGGTKMSAELIKNYIGRECSITVGGLGTSFSKVKIVEIIDNWMKVEGKGKVDLVNIEFIQSIRILPHKD